MFSRTRGTYSYRTQYTLRYLFFTSIRRLLMKIVGLIAFIAQRLMQFIFLRGETVVNTINIIRRTALFIVYILHFYPFFFFSLLCRFSYYLSILLYSILRNVGNKIRVEKRREHIKEIAVAENVKRVLGPKSHDRMPVNR